MTKPIYDISPFTLLDYPNKSACILWFTGCNMRCLYCYNPDIVLGKGKMSIEDALHFLRKRKNLLQAVVFSGGECTMHPALLQLAQEAKAMGYLVKVDTNGSRPAIMMELIRRNLLDYVALDFKGLGERFKHITVSNLFGGFEETYALLQANKIPFEVRTTVHSELLSLEDLQEMISYLENKKYVGTYYLQSALNDVITLVDLPRSSYPLQLERLVSHNFNILCR
ncbi:anaerobic ribonucleoside-triphosphate reductase activating protein [Sphingobacterium sp. 1.A.4]|uniref:anaerobic ribonucleoside-triphosphate reductase activating protein n=1 Tax=Sphingobacterium sp. 1.A.4 TaxID=2044603 RepID=UPI000C0BD569|nr:anaerobic ribonucleoside-triphosphate reductase activating protein [Sphingobacterium sp. 1.A.4]